jgi:hypothetical protein
VVCTRTVVLPCIGTSVKFKKPLVLACSEYHLVKARRIADQATFLGIFCNDSRDRGIKVVVRHEPLGKRTTQEVDVPFFGAPSYEKGALTIPLFNHGLGIAPQIPVVPYFPTEGEFVVRGETFGLIDENT